MITPLITAPIVIKGLTVEGSLFGWVVALVVVSIKLRSFGWIIILHYKWYENKTVCICKEANKQIAVGMEWVQLIYSIAGNVMLLIISWFVGLIMSCWTL